MPSWPPTTLRTHPGEEPAPHAPDGVIDVTPETLGDRKAVADINEFRARLEAQRKAERSRQGDDLPPRAA
jgi:hypothetical protein